MTTGVIERKLGAGVPVIRASVIIAVAVQASATHALPGELADDAHLTLAAVAALIATVTTVDEGRWMR
ncbi:MAG: hypothetical protein U0232_15690 [Thermomicrobiales bacterium]